MSVPILLSTTGTMMKGRTKMNELVIPVIVLSVCICGIIASMAKLYRAINKLINDGIHETLDMAISSEDIEKIVKLVLDEIDKRHE